MHIFIDESGTFTRSTTKTSISLVGSLTLRDSVLSRIEKKYKKLRQHFPKERGEVKGRLLNEKQVGGVVDLLRRNDALLEIVAIDLDLHTDDEISAHKQAQAEGMTREITAAHHPNVQKGAQELRRRVEGLADQLYIQSVVMFELAWITTDHSINYYAQRWPRELSQFNWVIDGKNKEQITDWEDWWATVVMPILQSKSIRRPHATFEGGDYTFFQRFRTEYPDYLPRPKSDDGMGINLGLLMMENFRFSSDPEPGLEMVDILVNAVRRSIIGNLQYKGWQDIPRLMIHRRKHYITLIALHGRPLDKELPYESIINKFRRRGRSMLAPRFND